MSWAKRITASCVQNTPMVMKMMIAMMTERSVVRYFSTKLKRLPTTIDVSVKVSIRPNAGYRRCNIQVGIQRMMDGTD